MRSQAIEQRVVDVFRSQRERSSVLQRDFLRLGEAPLLEVDQLIELFLRCAEPRSLRGV